MFLKKCFNINFFLLTLLGVQVSTLSNLLEEKKRLAPNLVFYDTKKTLNKIKSIIQKKEKGVYLRFGDGDVYLSQGKNDSYQKCNESLFYEMTEAFALNGKNIIKALPITCKEL